MTSAQNTQQPGQRPVLKQTVVENIDQYLSDGMSVFDANGDRVGTVKMFSTAAGYLIAGQGPLTRKDLYIPFRLIRSIDPHDIFVSETRDALASRYAQPPAITTAVEHRLVPGPAGSIMPHTFQVQVVESGYDGAPAALSSVDVLSVANSLAIGMAVYDVEGVRLGDLTQYDNARSLLVVEQGIFNPRVLFVPFSAIQTVDPDAFTVYLSLPRDVMVKEHAMLPADA
jgi:ribosomal 30S subunit maturation factor RimM